MFFTGKFILDILAFARSLEMPIAGEVGSLELDRLARENELVTYEEVEQLFLSIGKHAGEIPFGLLMGEQINLMATQFLDQLMDECETVMQAFEHAVTFSRLISDAMICSLEEGDEYFRVNFELNPDWALKNDYAVSQNLDLALLCTQKSLLRLTQKEYYPREVNFYYTKPKRLNEHLRLFNSHLNFGQPVSSIVFHKTILGQRTTAPKSGLLEHLQLEAAQLMASLPPASPLVTKVKQTILKNISPGSFQITEVAKSLNVTPRTLQRKLSGEKNSFNEILKDLRFQLSLKLMKEGILNLDEIAYLTGYSESSAFIRAFRNWTGTSPKKYFKNTLKAKEI